MKNCVIIPHAININIPIILHFSYNTIFNLTIQIELKGPNVEYAASKIPDKRNNN